MPKKNVEVLQGCQLGFGFGVQDAQGNKPAFLSEPGEVREALELIGHARWASVDVETTGLTEASMPVELTPWMMKSATASNRVRMRTMQVRVAENGRDGKRVDFAFDADALGPAATREVAGAILARRLFIAHNAGFDLYWLRRAQGRQCPMPEFVADTMLLTRLLAPEVVLERAHIIEGVKSAEEAQAKSAQAAAAWKSLATGASGGSLADVVLAFFGVVVDKTYQKPDNWTGLLGFEHYDYAIDDVVWADRILCRLLNLDQDAGDLLRGYLVARARNENVIRLESQVPDVVRMREVGMPCNPTVGEHYVREKNAQLDKEVDALVGLEPALAPFRNTLADPDAGLDNALKLALAQAFESRGVSLRKTAATGAPQVGEKDLRACMAAKIEEAKPLFKAWVAVCKAKKLRQMALETMGFAKRGDDGKLRSLISHGPLTGRLSAAEPNCFTGDTEILTEAGWQRFDALSRDVRVAQYERGEISFVKPLGYVEHEFKGELVHNQTRAIDLLTTPNHRCLLLSRNTKQEKIFEAADYPEDYIQVHAGTYPGGAGLPLTDRQLRFLVAAQADGSWHDGGINFSFYRPRKIERFSALFGFAPRFGISQFSIGSARARFHVRKADELCVAAQQYLGPKKEFGPWVLELSRAQLDVFLEELDYWDGLYTRRGRQITYTTISKTSADWVQAAYSLSGVRVRLVAYKAHEHRLNQSWRVQGANSRSTSYTTNRRQASVPHSGRVYCVTVPAASSWFAVTG
jgi:hypothetical protein